MSLEAIVNKHELTPIKGVYCIFYFGEKIVLVSNPLSDLEPKGKAEGDYFIHDELTPLNLDQLSVVSGGAKNENLLLEMIREIKEETGLTISEERLKPLNTNPTRTIQSRNGKGFFDIEGTGFKLELTIEELKQLIDYLILNDRNMVAGSIHEFEDVQHIELRPFVISVLAQLNQLALIS